MAVYKDQKRGTWYAIYRYHDWTGKNVQKMKRGFATKKEAQEWERHFLLTKAASLDMSFEDFYTRYRDDVKSKLKQIHGYLRNILSKLNFCHTLVKRKWWIFR